MLAVLLLCASVALSSGHIGMMLDMASQASRSFMDAMQGFTRGRGNLDMSQIVDRLNRALQDAGSAAGSGQMDLNGLMDSLRAQFQNSGISDRQFRKLADTILDMEKTGINMADYMKNVMDQIGDRMNMSGQMIMDVMRNTMDNTIKVFGETMKGFMDNVSKLFDTGMNFGRNFLDMFPFGHK